MMYLWETVVDSDQLLQRNQHPRNLLSPHLPPIRSLRSLKTQGNVEEKSRLRMEIPKVSPSIDTNLSMVVIFVLATIGVQGALDLTLIILTISMKPNPLLSITPLQSIPMLPENDEAVGERQKQKFLACPLPYPLSAFLRLSSITTLFICDWRRLIENLDLTILFRLNVNDLPLLLLHMMLMVAEPTLVKSATRKNSRTSESN
jgi:hypothetical protein